MVIAVSCFLAVILLLSVLKEVKATAGVLEGSSLVSLFVPSWAFFAPVPGMLDYQLLYREFFIDGTRGDWRQPYQLLDSRHWYACLWHFEKRLMKAIFDLTADLLQLGRMGVDKRQICTSLPYLHILNHVCALPHSSSAVKIQFMIVSNSRVRDPSAVFVSEPHSVEQHGS